MILWMIATLPLDITVFPGEFSPTSTVGTPSARAEHTAVWTGTEMIIWGGFSNGTFFRTGAEYDPSTDTWNATPTAGAPSVRQFHTSVWADSEMIVWGGNYRDTGGIYDLVADTWTTVNTTGAPTGRNFHTAIWTDTEMIIWGGDTAGGPGGLADTGARYDPITDTWTSTNMTGAPTARQGHTAVWTGTEMIIWGGNDGTPLTDTGGIYNPSNDTWTSISTTGAPTARFDHTAVWTGTEMVVWGGDITIGGGGLTNTGARYDPSTDTWTTTSTTEGPLARTDHTSVWTGTEMVVWGGFADSGRTDTGGRYDPVTDTWTPPMTDAPLARDDHTAVWTGRDMIVWEDCFHSLLQHQLEVRCRHYD